MEALWPIAIHFWNRHTVVNENKRVQDDKAGDGRDKYGEKNQMELGRRSSHKEGQSNAYRTRGQEKKGTDNLKRFTGNWMQAAEDGGALETLK